MIMGRSWFIIPKDTLTNNGPGMVNINDEGMVNQFISCSCNDVKGMIHQSSVKIVNQWSIIGFGSNMLPNIGASKTDDLELLFFQNVTK